MDDAIDVGPIHNVDGSAQREHMQAVLERHHVEHWRPGDECVAWLQIGIDPADGEPRQFGAMTDQAALAAPVVPLV